MKNCIWALLTVNELKFVTIPCFDRPDILMGRSLFEFIHPEEVTLAQRDLYKFTSTKPMGGSVTRCRIQDFSTIYSASWIVVDIIMYIATDSLVLVFFHKDTPSIATNSCKDHNFSLVTLKNALEKFPVQSPRQFFHILDNQSKSVLLSWPDHYPNEIEGSQMSIFDDRPMSPQRPVSCFRCTQKPICTTPLGQKLHNLVIEYGKITFLLVKVTSASNNSDPLRSVSSSPELSDISRYRSPHYQQQQQQQQHGQQYRHPYLSSSKSSPSYDESIYYPPYTRKRCVSYEGMIKQECQNNSPSYSFGGRTSPGLHPVMQRKRCQSCGTHTSPEWRRGPTGHKTLCNACGLRYSRSIARQGKMALQKRHSSFQSQSTTPRTPPSPQSSLSSSTSSSSHSFHMNITDSIPFMPNYPKYRSF